MGEFLVWLYANDYEVTFGEATRPPELAALYASQGRGIANTLHGKRLALDLNLFVDSSLEEDEDVYQKDSDAYELIGTKWESMNPLCRWGGRFGDGNHFSVEHLGVR